MNHDVSIGNGRNLISVAIFALLIGIPPIAATAQTAGPDTGTLVIVGGGDRGFLVFREFIELSGGKNIKLVVIPTASSSDPSYPYNENGAARFARGSLEMPNVTIVHTHDRAEADTESFVEPIREADAIWFSGGRQWRIADAYLDTLTEKELKAVLDRGGVIGGSSAGASIQGSFLVRGDTSGSNVMIGDHQAGLGYMRNCAIDQHVIPRNRQAGLIEVLTDPNGKMESSIDRQALLGIGIDEATGIIVRQHEFEVVGKEDGVVLIYDPTTWSSDLPDERKYQALWHGAKYNLKEREILDGGTPPQPTVALRPEGFYKDIFVDGGVNLSSKKRLPAAESLGLSYEKYAGRSERLQRELFAGTETDTNGVLLYPDGQPRFRMIFVHGGGATKHGQSLGPSGRRAIADFFDMGGSYCGSCAGSFLSGLNTDSHSEPRDGYLHIFPYNTRNTGIKKSRVGHRIPAASPLLQFHDFGTDAYVDDIYHNNGNWLAKPDLAQMPGVEVLATYDTPDKETDDGVAIWAWKKSGATGRIINIGSHPESVTDGERLALTEACIRYAVSGNGSPTVKATLEEGVERHMNKRSSSNDPTHTRIGDRQYHHFAFDVEPSTSEVTVEVTGDDRFDLNLYLHKEMPAFASNATFSCKQPGANPQIHEKLTPGRWYASVECATTVEAQLDETQSYFRYTGQTDVLNGVPYTIIVNQENAGNAAESASD